ncbi:MAG TPA: TRAP transporter substrate-binding protein [Alphaproteobacteria bacterium]|jgi:TRAP-type C4-dicarboxylate transport system substrate-binding protein
MRRIAYGAALGGLGLAALASLASAETVELKISHIFPSSHFNQTRVLQPWADEITKKTGGKVKFAIYASGSALGDINKQFDQTRAGAVDISLALPGVPRARHPRTVLMELPFVVRKASTATKVLNEMYDKYLKPDFPGVKMITLTSTNAGSIHSRTKPIKDIADLKGMRVRSPTPPITAMLEFIGATPVGLPPTQIYENAEKGTIDAVVMPWGPVGAFKLQEVLSHHLDADSYVVTQYIIMNQKSYDSLAPDVRKVFDEVSAQHFTAEKWGKIWTDTDEEAVEAAKKRGHKIEPVAAETRNKWRRQLQPVIDKYLAEQEKGGLKNVREIFAEMQKLIGQYEK